MGKVRVNGQPVDHDALVIAMEAEGIDTAVVAFFDVGYTRSAFDKGHSGERARKRSVSRENPKSPFLRK